jgi:Na+/glutamate symporter
MMEIKWSNIVAFALAVFALIVFSKTWPLIAAFFAAMKAIGPGHDPDQQVQGLVAFGLIALTLVGIVKILSSSGRNP